ncbi:unnamed protein product [Laminaria digitata]
MATGAATHIFWPSLTWSSRPYGIVQIESRDGFPTLRRIRWWRMVLDESHSIANTNSISDTAKQRIANRRWCMTGCVETINSLPADSLTAVVTRYSKIYFSCFWCSQLLDSFLVGPCLATWATFRIPGALWHCHRGQNDKTRAPS